VHYPIYQIELPERAESVAFVNLKLGDRVRSARVEELPLLSGIEQSATFQITNGRDRIATYKGELPYQYDRCFCSVCGSALGEVLSESDSFPVAANCIDGDIGVENQFHEFVSEKPSWLKIGDTAKQFDEHPFES
jgi:hypothetical protein